MLVMVLIILVFAGVATYYDVKENKRNYGDNNENN